MRFSWMLPLPSPLLLSLPFIKLSVLAAWLLAFVFGLVLAVLELESLLLLLLILLLALYNEFADSLLLSNEALELALRTWSKGMPKEYCYIYRQQGFGSSWGSWLEESGHCRCGWRGWREDEWRWAMKGAYFCFNFNFSLRTAAAATTTTTATATPSTTAHAISSIHKLPIHYAINYNDIIYLVGQKTKKTKKTEKSRKINKNKKYPE